jgi:spore coat protein CotF
MTEIILKLRNLIGDFYESIHDYFQVEDKIIFTLTNTNINSTSIVIYKNGTLVDEEDYTFNVNTNKITWTPSTSTDDLIAGDLLDVVYDAYTKYSENEIKGYIRAAISNLSIYGYRTFKEKSDIIFPTPTESEENLISVIAAILITGSIKQYRTPEITFIFADDLSKEDKIRQAINQYSKTFGYFSYDKIDENEEENG